MKYSPRKPVSVAVMSGTVTVYDDYSLSEVAEILDVSRNAVFDNLKKAVHLLENYEEKLQLMKKHQERLDLIKRIEDDMSLEHKEIVEYLEMLRKI